MTELRRQAWSAHAALPWPHPSDDIWRRTDASLLDPTQGFSLAASAPQREPALPPAGGPLASLAKPVAGELLFVRSNGSWLARADARGVAVEELTQAAGARPDSIRSAIEADGLTKAEQKLASLNAAFHHDDLVVQVPAGFVGREPIRLVHLTSVTRRQAIVPMTVILVGAGSSLTLIDEYASAAEPPSSCLPHVVNARIELVIEPDAQVQYVRLQRWDAQAREFLFQRAMVAGGASLTAANLTLGASVSKAHLVTKLMGPRATTKLYGFVFGTGARHIDQHTLQDHQAPQTESDLQFRAALQDGSRMIYTGLIRIAREAKRTLAYQANHNLLLSQTAKAETIPMLEILADDVQCKHGASVGPIDEEQVFYLMSRGIPRERAQRLIVMGFVEPIIRQVPFGPLQERLREEIEGGLRD